MTYSIISIKTFGHLPVLPELSFFTTKILVPGQIIKARIMGRSMSAIVTKIDHVSIQKQNLRKSRFILKQLVSEESAVILDQNFIGLTQTLATHNQTEISHILNLVLPRFDILKGLNRFHVNIRNQSYESRRSEIVCAPNQYFAEQNAKLLSRETGSLVLVHPKLSPKETVKRIDSFINGKVKLAVITPQYLSILGSSASSITIGHAGENYRSALTPKMDQRVYIEAYTKASKCELRYEDRIQPIDRADKVGSFRYSRTGLERTHPKFVFVDTRKQNESNPHLRGLSQESIDLVNSAVKNNDRVLIVCARKGLAPVSACRDCGALILCNKCGATLTLRSSVYKTTYFCYRCKLEETTERVCKQCGSWNIKALGAGIEKILSAVQHYWPHQSNIVISRDTQPSMASAARKVDNTARQVGIVLAIDSVVPYLHTRFAHVIVLGSDTLLASPSYGARELLYRHLRQLKQITEQTLLIQTKTPNSSFFNQIKEENDRTFAQSELAERKQFGYPPFITLVKISVDTSYTKHRELMEKALALGQAYNASCIQTGIPGARNSRLVLIIKVATELWPNDELSANLETLTSTRTSIEVNPTDLS